jgi:serine/threonine protein kinase
MGEVTMPAGPRQVRLLTVAEVKDATDNFSSDRLIGRGVFSKVFLAKPVPTTTGGCEAAAKRIFKDDPGMNYMEGYSPSAGALKEIALLSMCDHPCVQRLYGFCVEPRLCLVYQLARCGSLRDRILSTEHGLSMNPDQGRSAENSRKRLSRLGLPVPTAPLRWWQRARILYDIAAGIEYLHRPLASKPRIIHGDLHLDNVLIDEALNAKIADLGLSSICLPDRPAGPIPLEPVLREAGKTDVADALASGRSSSSSSAAAAGATSTASSSLIVPNATSMFLAEYDSNAVSNMAVNLATWLVSDTASTSKEKGVISAWRNHKGPSLELPSLDHHGEAQWSEQCVDVLRAVALDLGLADITRRLRAVLLSTPSAPSVA